MRSNRCTLTIVLCLALAPLGCVTSDHAAVAPEAAPRSASPLDEPALEYVQLALGARRLDADLVSAPEAPAELQARAEAAALPAPAIADAAGKLLQRLDALAPAAAGLEDQRRRNLRARIASLQMQMQAKGGAHWTVDEEVRRRYGFAPSFTPTAAYEDALLRLDSRVPGKGELSERIAVLRGGSVVPAAKQQAVFAAALAECRLRASAHLSFPRGESVEVRWTDDPKFPGNDVFQGNGRSVAELSRVIPTEVDRLLALACHEIYPGHHLHFATQSAELFHRRGWPEYSLELNYGPLVPTAEAVAEYGIGLAFPPADRLRFEREVLYPLAGLKMRDDDAWLALWEARDALLGASATVARDYLDGRIGKDEAVRQFTRYRLLSADGATRILPVVDALGSYVIASDLGWQAIEQRLRGRSQNERWAAFGRILREPMLIDDIERL
jgi:hypothetical protein